ncbi:MAG: type IV pilus assembly protein PilV [Oleispira sp.]|jgi:type IV pilus assembly protein PilV|tara:strand:- start:6758 stop:7390 length:633 start_codon:yes stop_codon:yes gene_type:complete
MKTLTASSNRISQGLTLIEVLVTMMITSIGLMGLMSLQMQALKATQDAGNHSHATLILNDLASRIRANKGSSSSYIGVGAVNCPFDPDPVPVTACSNYATGSVRVTSAVCTGPEMAAWDLFEVACGLPRDNINIQGNPIDALPSLPGRNWGPTITVLCPDPAGCADGDPLVLTLIWRARVDATEASAAIRQDPDNILSVSRRVNPRLVNL